MGIHILDSGIIQECELFQIFEDLNLIKFIYNPPKKVSPPLAKMLFLNLYFTDRIIYSNVRKHKIYIHLEVFANIFDLSHDWPIFKPYEQDDNFNYKTNASSYLKNLKSRVLSPLTLGSMHPDIHLIYYVTYSFPEKATSVTWLGLMLQLYGWLQTKLKLMLTEVTDINNNC